MTVGQRLKIVLERNGVKQKEFAALLGIRQNQMSLIINNKGELRHSSLQNLVLKIGINLNWLLTGEGPVYIKSTDTYVAHEPKIEYKTLKNDNYQSKYHTTLEKLSEANEKEVAYLRRIMDLESQLNCCKEKLMKKKPVR